ncbi:MAG: DUF262 domain-containing protein [Bacteroidia bacterium]|nr:DUF262 domain-containing protein [Bacteroidia bacterium]MBP9179430.1 DUF262 domain-containing protein [Bacteroidia bacterium]MBP9723709.1 DUF262 domain-containing protein [Bacteroidia bacterium]
MHNTNFNTFWKILNASQIEIPTIQRDYAHGRDSASTIRRNLVEKMITNLRTGGKLNLDFIYGKLVGKENQIAYARNKENISSLLRSIKNYANELQVRIETTIDNSAQNTEANLVFIPLDGQQRLTTLYLLHWYIIQQRSDTDALYKLSNFSYSTRISSKEFCKLICSKLFDFRNEGISPSELISNDEGFYSFWKKDPTVHSMLVVLDEFHNECSKLTIDYNSIWKNLTTLESITFDFFDLDDFSLTDELYIKMNARGKKLTDYENFKAWIIQQFDKKIDIPDWQKHLDIKWHDLFWKSKALEELTVDKNYLQFFKINYLCERLNELYQQNPKNSTFNNTQIENQLRDAEVNPIDIFRNDPSLFDKIETTLNILNKVDLDILKTADESLLKFTQVSLDKFLFGSKIRDYSWWDITLYYAITQYLIKSPKDPQYFKQWARFISNLIYNTPIETASLFAEAAKSIDRLLDRFNNRNSVYFDLVSLNEKDVFFFSGMQVKEEIHKADLIINKNIEWEDVIHQAESHHYFWGQIGFIFNLEVLNSTNLDVFKILFQKLECIFSEEIMKREDFLLLRALLKQGDVFYRGGYNMSFPSNSSHGALRLKNDNWRRIFNDVHHRSHLKSLLNCFPAPTTDAIAILKEQVSLATMVTDKNMRLLIQVPRLLEYCKKHCLKQDNKNIYLLNSTRILGYYAEVETYNWYLAKNSNEYMYSYAKGNAERPGIKFKNDEIDLLISKDEKTGEFKINNNTNSYPTIDLALNSIKYDQ